MSEAIPKEVLNSIQRGDLRRRILVAREMIVEMITPLLHRSTEVLKACRTIAALLKHSQVVSLILMEAVEPNLMEAVEHSLMEVVEPSLMEVAGPKLTEVVAPSLTDLVGPKPMEAVDPKPMEAVHHKETLFPNPTATTPHLRPMQTPTHSSAGHRSRLLQAVRVPSIAVLIILLGVAPRGAMAMQVIKHNLIKVKHNLTLKF